MAPEIQAIDDEAFAALAGRPGAGSVENASRKTAPLQAAHPLRGGGTAARPRRGGAGGAPGNVRAVDQRGHEVRHDHATNTAARSSFRRAAYSSFLNKRDPQLRKTAFHQFYKEFCGSPVHAGVGAGQFDQGGRVPRPRAQLSVRARGGAVFRPHPGCASMIA